MSWLARVTDQAEALSRARALMEDSRSAEAATAFERVIRSTDDPYARADALVQRLSALINLGRTAEYTAALEEAFDAVRELAEPYLHGHLHALAALAAHVQGALDRCVTHLVRSERALRAVDEPDRDTAWAWHDLAMAYSYLAFHGYALTAIEQARKLGFAAGIPEETFAAPGIRLRNAVDLDHHGDSDGCLRVLRDIITDLSRFTRTGRHTRLRPSSLVAYGYTLARHAALRGGADGPAPHGRGAGSGASPAGDAAGHGGDPTLTDPARLLAQGRDSARARDMRQLGEVCLAIAADQPEEALRRLKAANVSAETLGAAEHARLCSLAFTRAGDHPAAHRADRYAFRLAAQRNDRLRAVYVDGIAARIDQEEMRRDVARYGGESMTDPLTGLPNRRRLERYVAALVSRGERAVIGICDLTAFGAVNAAHGHHSGDLVLQRVAGVINRVMRQGDLVVRYGGDEFVVVLSGACMSQATEVGRRISRAVQDEDWAALVPGTPVRVSVGFAEVHPGTGLHGALSEALRVSAGTARSPRPAAQPGQPR